MTGGGAKVIVESRTGFAQDVDEPATVYGAHGD